MRKGAERNEDREEEKKRLQFPRPVCGLMKKGKKRPCEHVCRERVESEACL